MSMIINQKTLLNYMLIEKMTGDVNNIQEVKEVPGDGDKKKKSDGIKKWVCRGAFLCLL